MKFFDNIFSIPNEDNYSITGLNDELVVINIYNVFVQSRHSILVVCNSTFEANNLYSRLLNYSNQVLFFPMDDFITSEAIAISPEFKTERISTLVKLSINQKYIVVTNMMGYLRYLPKLSLWSKAHISLKRGDDVLRDKLLEDLFNYGYQKEVLVNGTGEVGVRGYVVDIFPIMEEKPIRIEFWGNTIDSIKYFDVNTQLTLGEIDEVNIYPFTEFILDSYSSEIIRKQKYLRFYSHEVSSIIDYLENPVVFFYNYNNILKNYLVLYDTIVEYKNNNFQEIDTNFMFSYDDIKPLRRIFHYHFDDDNDNGYNKYKYTFCSIFKYKGNYDLLRRDLVKYISEGKTVIICVGDKHGQKRIIDYLNIDGILLSLEDSIVKNKINIVSKNITDGFIYLDYVVLSESDLFDLPKGNMRYKSKYHLGTRVRSILNINPNDYVVHETFGIGIYYGLFTICKNGIKKDYLKLGYADGDFLYIPVENIDRISKFTGGEGASFKLSSLSNDGWKKRRSKVREKLESIADDLIKVSAQREILHGYAFSQDDENQAIFDSQFIYSETPDQIKAINEIKKLMEKDRPMDMLLCGDVGYGKTEVAFRAMFKAVNDNKQVAYLCPTTVLSSQQFESAKVRFASFPVRIALINRFVDMSKQKQILEELEEGKIDILFGTHRILSNDIKFKDLGLLVVDEEQRFGVTHKEKIKKFKASIDVLTLSATPIPRTLQMSLTGLRSLSLIETPPKERYPIQTYVLEESDLVIKDAIYKELGRGGQAFILFNRIENIEKEVNKIKKLVPEALIDFVHGRMSKEQLERKMFDFTKGKFNVLVCTSIIETGIDIPNVNTLIILDADHFGLSQLYQIRGRIGRSNKIGYAYLMYDGRKILTDTAVKRLDTIKEFTELGSGFKIAMRDLSIRGAGDILGRSQSGFIDTIGIDLYLKMLNNAINRARGVVEDVEDDGKNDKPLINVSTSIDDNYVMDSELKIAIHRLINEVSTEESFLRIKNELEDRFGKLNNDLIIYMYEEWFESLAKRLNVTDVRDMNNYVDLVLNSNVSKLIEITDLSNYAREITRMFRFSYKDDCLHIILDKVNLEEHYLMYLVKILVWVNSNVDNKL